MNPSSRTPEGDSLHCPLCGNDVRLELSTYPVHDGTCPHCGHLIQWFSASRPIALTSSSRASIDNAAPDSDDEPFSTFERRWWTVLAVVSTVTVFANDGVVHALLWLLAMMVLATLIVPRMYRRAHASLERSDDLYLGVVFGWALVPGPLVGILFGTILPAVYDCGLSSLIGGFMGLLLGPCFAVIEGLSIVFVVDAVFWLVTGRRIGKAT